MLTNARRVALALVTAYAIFGLHIGGAAAQGFTTFTVDENCNGTVTIMLGSPADCLAVEVQVTPMTYSLLGAAGVTVTPGDIQLYNNLAPLVLSEVIRFAGTGSNSTLVFYSDVSDVAPGVRANIGFPETIITPTSLFAELGPESGNNGFVYTPT